MKTINLNTVQEVISKHELRKNSRQRELVWKRYAFYNFMRKNSRLSLGEIGKLSGGKDHASVLHGLREYEKQSRYEDFRWQVSEIEEQLYRSIEADTDILCHTEKEVMCLRELEQLIKDRL